jgi:hypothetical protein
MSDANHYAQQAMMYKSMVQQIAPIYEAAEKSWELVDPATADWKTLSNPIRAAHTYATQMVDCVFGYGSNMAEVERAKSIFRGSKAAMEVAQAFQPEIEKWKAKATRWFDLAKQYQVTLCREDAPDEIGLLADAELLDAYRHRGTKIPEADFEALVEDIKQRFSISTTDFEIWLAETGNK